MFADQTIQKISDKDMDVIQSSLAYEHAGIAAYAIAGASGLLSPETLKVALIFKGHHEGHRDALVKLITDVGGVPVQPKSDADYVEELKLGTLKTEADVVALATGLELGAASGYIKEISSIEDPQLAHLFAQISADEMIHWTTLNNAQGTPIPAAAFQFG